jgi:hypothetical protein
MRTQQLMLALICGEPSCAPGGGDACCVAVCGKACKGAVAAD